MTTSYPMLSMRLFMQLMHSAASSPVGVRAKYMLYDNKICTGDEAAECINCMKRRMESIGYEVVIDRGDYKG